MPVTNAVLPNFVFYIVKIGCNKYIDDVVFEKVEIKDSPYSKLSVHFDLPFNMEPCTTYGLHGKKSLY